MMSQRIQRILNISYDSALAHTREQLLKNEGFKVTSVIGLTEAITEAKRCNYDLAIVGHSIPRSDKSKMVDEIRICDGHIKILSLRRPGDAPILEADQSMEAADGPFALLEAVRQLFSIGI